MSTDAPLSHSTTELLAAAVKSLGGATRTNQVRMAKAVTHAIEAKRHLAVQAGTGTGKSLAYLVPAIRHAQASDSTVIVSTATLALQRQLIERDLPRLAQALTPVVSRPPTFAIMKGRANYLCLNKLGISTRWDNEEQLPIDEETISSLGAHIKRVYQWAEKTSTGDRDDLVPGVPDNAWRQVSVNAQECIGASRCPHGEDCFAEQTRRKAREVDIVVTNHALLAIDALSEVNVLPEHDVVVVDEAHELDGRITAVSTNEIGLLTLKMSATRAKKLQASKRDERLVEIAQEWEDSMEAVDEGRLTHLPEQLATQLIALRDALWSLKNEVSSAPEGEEANDPERFAERRSLSNHLSDQHDSIVRILEVFKETDPTKQTDVVWLSKNERQGLHLKVAPLSIAGLLHTHLFQENTVILTSATLSIGGNFTALAASWGLHKGSWESLDVGMPFDPKKSGILYTPTHIPIPGRDGLAKETLTEMYELIMASGGRTLGLFSSRRAALQAKEELGSRLPFDVYCQGDDAIGTLIENFSKNENSCLFGTLTLWQGVDVPGSACSLVIMDKIPFPRPDDPLLQARKEAADAQGRNGFMEVAATHAALLMAQGAGRLLRQTTDKGVVAVMDKRLVEKRYGTFLLNSMPDFWRTTDPRVVTAALKRLVQG
ncbi:putative ATP-dependent DNA helicase [Corynebacterium kutscheri]|uniref:ATP-dependent helicase DinG n=1 Tax=Corynebacterium kutscheri TaxID=35755 RepID=A0A0F6TCM4_9CORY|nr:ATP-dependent DNA helicase [Corynebacterium kutscheri]AKE40831.1 DNA helicase, Rad3 [Corynebacterium kutscheri]VEH09128.1 putative ATP-dependent DNA helicase [Corynebacterium kutscheri]VEH82462.1 putative ATP-dependent DNA helicase [Corynebacterium kutscheri]